MVEMVLLGMPDGLEFIRAHCFAVRRLRGQAGGYRGESEGFREQVFRIQGGFHWGRRRGNHRVRYPLRLHLRLLHQNVELPEEMMRSHPTIVNCPRWALTLFSSSTWNTYGIVDHGGVETSGRDVRHLSRGESL